MKVVVEFNSKAIQENLLQRC